MQYNKQYRRNLNLEGGQGQGTFVPCSTKRPEGFLPTSPPNPRAKICPSPQCTLSEQTSPHCIPPMNHRPSDMMKAAIHTPFRIGFLWFTIHVLWRVTPQRQHMALLIDSQHQVHDLNQFKHFRVQERPARVCTLHQKGVQSGAVLRTWHVALWSPL